MFPLGGNYDVYKTLQHPSSSFFHEKRSKKQMLKHKNKKEAILRGLRRKEAMKGMGMGFHTSMLETRTNLCSLAKRFITIWSK